MTPPAGLTLLERIQAQMRAVARRQYETVAVPPFTLFFHDTDSLAYFNYAIPDGDGATSGDIAAPLARLEEEFRVRRRVPRFEYVEACAPLLAKTLEAHGFARQRAPLGATRLARDVLREDRPRWRRVAPEGPRSRLPNQG